jgi:uncharacterized secreted protein with C-terminal beta-propeller domain
MSTVGTTSDATSSSDPFSSTNTQVAGVDEADTVKTDGTYIYTYSPTRQNISIVRMDTLSLIKTLTLPASFSSIEMYIQNGKLVIVGSIDFLLQK